MWPGLVKSFSSLYLELTSHSKYKHLLKREIWTLLTVEVLNIFRVLVKVIICCSYLLFSIPIILSSFFYDTFISSMV